MLETPEDARQIHAACLGCNVVLVGTSFVGTVFSVCVKDAHTVLLHVDGLEKE